MRQAKKKGGGIKSPPDVPGHPVLTPSKGVLVSRPSRGCRSPSSPPSLAVGISTSYLQQERDMRADAFPFDMSPSHFLRLLALRECRLFCMK